MNSFSILPWLVVCLVIRPSYSQTTYPCNASASCGCSANSATLSRIVGGEAANANTWGWIVSILINGNLQCGGSILSSTWILTAAHCVPRTATSIQVYAGSTTRFSGTQVISASAAYIHLNYTSSGFLNDIALVKLSSPLNLNAVGVDTICLPSVSAATLAAGEWPPANTTVVAIGWGKLFETATSSSISLQQVTLKTVSRLASTCTPVINNWNLHFCAGYVGGGRGTCQGDSGGPVMIFNQQWYVAGIVSYGIGCARANYSGVYVRVAYYRSWINSIMNGGGGGAFNLTFTARPSTSAAAIVNPMCLHLFLLIVFMLTLNQLKCRTFG